MAREKGAGSRGWNPAEGKETPRGALQLAWSPGAGLELFNSGLEILEDLRALLSLELVVQGLHRSPGNGLAAMHLQWRFGLEGVRVQKPASVAMATPRKPAGRENPRVGGAARSEGTAGRALESRVRLPLPAPLRASRQGSLFPARPPTRLWLKCPHKAGPLHICSLPPRPNLPSLLLKVCSQLHERPAHLGGVDS